MVCGTIGRPCPKLASDPTRATTVGPFTLPPPCIYLFPATIPGPRNNPNPAAQSITDVQLLSAFQQCFRGAVDELSFVTFEVQYRGADIVRTTRVERAGVVQRVSTPTAIQRA
jgi:hypothetical protein